MTLMCLVGLDGGGDYVPYPRQEVLAIRRSVDPPVPSVQPRLSGENVLGSVTPTEVPKPSQGDTGPVSNVWWRLAVCESGMNGEPRWSINNGNGFSGGLQFTARTWDAFRPSHYPSDAHNATPTQQVSVGRLVAETQGAGAWPSCTSKLGISTEELLR